MVVQKMIKSVSVLSHSSHAFKIGDSIIFACATDTDFEVVDNTTKKG